MKYYFCLMILVGALNAMEAPPVGSPPPSPQIHSAPNSPTRYKYTREQLLALGKSTLSRSMDSEIGRVQIKVRGGLSMVKIDDEKPSADGCLTPAMHKKPAAAAHKKPAATSNNRSKNYRRRYFRKHTSSELK